MNEMTSFTESVTSNPGTNVGKGTIENKARKAKRNAFPAQNQPSATIQPNFEDLKSIKSNLEGKKSLSQLSISPKGIETLKTISQVIPTNGDFPLIIYPIHYLHIQITSLINYCQTSIRIEKLEKKCEDIKINIYFLSYNFLRLIVSVNRGLDLIKEDLSKLFSQEKFVREVIDSPSFESIILSRFQNLKGGNKKTFNGIKDKALNFLNEIKKSFLLLEELLTLPEDDFPYFLEQTQNTISDWKNLENCSNMPIEKELSSLQEALINIIKLIYSNSETAHYQESPVIVYANFFQKLISMLETKHLSKDKILEEFILLWRIRNQVDEINNDALNIGIRTAARGKSPENFRLELEPYFSSENNLAELFSKGDLTFAKYSEEFGTSLEISDDFSCEMSRALVVCSVFQNLARSFEKVASRELNQRYRFFASETEMIELHIIWKKLSLYVEDVSSSQLYTILINKFSEKIQSFGFLSSAIPQIEQCIESIFQLKKIIDDRAENNPISFLDEYIHSEYELNQWIGARAYFKDLKEKVAHFEKIMDKCNKAIQKALEQSDLQVIQILENLEMEILTFKTDISEFLAPLLNLPSVLDKLFYLAPNCKIKTQGSYKIDLQDDIKKLFSINFQKYHKKVKPIVPNAFLKPIEDVSIINNKEPLQMEQQVFQPPINLDWAVQKTMIEFESDSFLMGAEDSQKVKAAPIKNDYSSKDCVDLPSSTAESIIKPVQKSKTDLEIKTSPSREIKTGPPRTTKTGKILAYLAQQGWAPLNTNGSHLKLFKSLESLIVPINKIHIDKGTLGAILRQKEEKEMRIKCLLENLENKANINKNGHNV